MAAALQAGLDRHPRSAELHGNLALMCAACGRRLDSTLDHDNRATALAPDNVEYLDTLAQVQFRHGRRQTAIETARHGLELAPGFEDLRRQLKRFSQDRPASRPG